MSSAFLMKSFTFYLCVVNKGVHAQVPEDNMQKEVSALLLPCDSLCRSGYPQTQGSTSLKSPESWDLRLVALNVLYFFAIMLPNISFVLVFPTLPVTPITGILYLFLLYLAIS